MRTLEFIVSGQRLSKKSSNDFLRIILGSKQYLRLEFSFDDDWKSMVKAAEFRPRNSENTYPVLITDNFCMVPDEITDFDLWFVRVVGKKGATYIRTNEVKVRQEE